MFIFCPRRQKTNQKNAAQGEEGFNQTKARQTKNNDEYWLLLDFNISPSPRPLPLCGRCPRERLDFRYKEKSFRYTLICVVNLMVKMMLHGIL